MAKRKVTTADLVETYGYRRLAFALIAEEFGASIILKHAANLFNETTEMDLGDSRYDAIVETAMEMVGSLVQDIERAIDFKFKDVCWEYQLDGKGTAIKINDC